MADLQRSNAEWEALLERRVGLTMLAPIRLLREIEDRFRKTRTQVRVLGDVDANVDTSGVTLAGVDPGVNCTPTCGCYVRITGSGPYTVSLYKATGGGSSDKVAEGSGAADSEVTLSASNSSGLTGTWDLPASVTVTTDDSLQVQAFVDFKALIETVYDDTFPDDDTYAKEAMSSAYLRAANAIRTAKQEILAGMREALIGNRATNPEGLGNAFAKARETNLAVDQRSPDTSGNVYRIRTGLFPALKRGMEDETSGSTQYVVKRVVSAAAGVAGSNNQGQGTISAWTPLEKCPAGRLHLECTVATLGRETFSGYFRLDDSEEDVPITGVEVGKIFSGPKGLGQFQIERTLSKTGDGSNTELAAASAFSVTGLTAANTDDGVLYWKLVANGSNWNVEFYKSSTYSAVSLVARAINIATDGDFTAAPQNTGLTVEGTVGSGPTDGTTGTLNLNPFRSESSGGDADTFSVTVTVTAGAGLYQTLLAEEIGTDGAQLYSTTSGSETIDDDYVRSGTFPAFAVEDN